MNSIVNSALIFNVLCPYIQEPIVNLLTEDNLANSSEYGFDNFSLEANALQNFFNDYNKVYCSQFLKIAPTVCQEVLTGANIL